MDWASRIYPESDCELFDAYEHQCVGLSMKFKDPPSSFDGILISAVFGTIIGRIITLLVSAASGGTTWVIAGGVSALSVFIRDIRDEDVSIIMYDRDIIDTSGSGAFSSDLQSAIGTGYKSMDSFVPNNYAQLQRVVNSEFSGHDPFPVQPIHLNAQSLPPGLLWCD